MPDDDKKPGDPANQGFDPVIPGPGPMNPGGAGPNPGGAGPMGAGPVGPMGAGSVGPMGAGSAGSNPMNPASMGAGPVGLNPPSPPDLNFRDPAPVNPSPGVATPGEFPYLENPTAPAPPAPMNSDFGAPVKADIPSVEAPTHDVLPSDKMPEDLSKGEKDKDLHAVKPEELLGVKPPDFYTSNNEVPDRVDEPKKIKKPKKSKPESKPLKPPEAFEGEVVSGFGPRPAPEELPVKEDPKEQFKSDLKDIMGNVGFPKKTYLAFFFILLFIGMVIVYFVFFKNPFDFLSDDSSDNSSDEQKQEEVLDDSKIENLFDEYGLNVSLYYGYADRELESIVSSEQFGDTKAPSPEFSSGIYASLLFGGIKQIAILDYVKYMNAIMELQNVYNTDLQSMLDSSSTRLATLEAHVVTFENIFKTAQNRREEMIADMARIKEHYDETTLEKDQLEEKFFVAASAFDGTLADSYLKQFIVKYKEQITFKSKYNAMAKLQEYYESALPKAASRIADIKTNADALVSGVKVTDIYGSDIDLIEPDEADL